MSVRDDLLVQIVEALGGVVTNPNDRNSLMLQWEALV